MVNGSGKLDKLFQKYRDNILKDRQRFEIEELESFLIKKIGGISKYQSVGGYQTFYKLIKDKEINNKIRPINSSPYNGRQPALKSRWQIQFVSVEGWQDQLIFKLSRQLDLRYYLNRPQFQTEDLAEKLLRISEFLEDATNREWASREERSLELFDNEKFLSCSEGKKLLSRLKLDLSDLKAEKYSQMFVYWKKGKMISKILVLENHSAFIACKRALEAGYKIFSYDADTLIYGQGKHIIDSLKFIDELIYSDYILETQPHNSMSDKSLIKYNKEEIKIKYAGDIDPEGWLIYYRLKERYPDFNIEIFTEYYQEMFNQANKRAYLINNKQNKNSDVLDQISGELMNKYDNKGRNITARIELAAKIKQLWNENLRLPQELITYEALTYNK